MTFRESASEILKTNQLLLTSNRHRNAYLIILTSATDDGFIPPISSLARKNGFSDKYIFKLIKDIKNNGAWPFLDTLRECELVSSTEEHELKQRLEAARNARKENPREPLTAERLKSFLDK